MGVLRLALAISVLCTHLGRVHAHSSSIFGCTFLDGGLAVELFFMISGFYMALVLHEKYVGAGSYSIFLIQRILRLCPTYLATLLITIIVLALLLAVGAPIEKDQKSLFFWHTTLTHIGLIPMLWISLSNLVVAGLNELSYFALDPKTGSFLPWNPLGPASGVPMDGFLLNPPAWSISLEIYFYILAPALVRWPVGRQLVILLASMALRYFIEFGLHWSSDLYVYRNFFCQIGFFMAGSLGYRFYIAHREQLVRWGKSLRHCLWPLIFGMLFYRRLPCSHDLYLVVIPLMFFLIPMLFALTHNHPLDRLVGELSYPFYLSHFLVLAIAFAVRDYLGMIWAGPFCLLLTLGISWLVYRYLESWSERFRARLFHHWRPKPPLSPEYFPQEAIEGPSSTP